MVRIIGICGSLRAASYNRGLLRAAAAMLPAGATLDMAEIGALPLMNQDLERPGWPAEVVAFRQALWAADAILFACPEYNAGIPAPLKNAVDWASRFEGANRTSAPPGETRKTPLQETPAAIIGATLGATGTARAQAHLRTVLLATGMRLLPAPDAYVGNATQRFDAHGELTDEASRAAVARTVAALVEWTELLKRG